MRKKVLLPALLLSVALLFASSVGFAAAAPGGKSGQAKSVVTKVTSNSMVYNSDAGKVTFSKNVKVVHPDFTMTSEKLDLYLAKDGAAGGASSSYASSIDAGKIETAIALTNVHITLPQGRSAQCKKATYTVRDEVLKMEGDPVLREEGKLLLADVIYFYFKTDQSQAEGNVRVEFVSKNNREGDGEPAANTTPASPASSRSPLSSEAGR